MSPYSLSSLETLHRLVGGWIIRQRHKWDKKAPLNFITELPGLNSISWIISVFS